MRPYLKKQTNKNPNKTPPKTLKNVTNLDYWFIYLESVCAHKNKQTNKLLTTKQTKKEMITWITNSGNLKPGYAKDRSSNDTAITSFQLLK